MYIPKKWTEEEEKFLKENIEHKTNAQLAEALGRTPGSVMGRLFKLGYRRTKEARYRNNPTSWRKGNDPWNKNLKGIHLSPKSEFKKGNIPASTKYDGCITVRYDHHNHPYKYIRLGNNHWQEMHRYIWETYHGKKIPPKHVVRFKDGDTLNCHISNLELISRSAHLRRNWTPPKITDEHAALTLSHRQHFTKEDVLKYRELIDLQKIRLHHNRELRYARQKNTTDK
jgi:hypothetical protein